MTHESLTGRLENHHYEYTATEPFKWSAKWCHQLLRIRSVSLNCHIFSFVFMIPSSYSCWPTWPKLIILTHWGRVTHIFISELTIIGSDNGLPPEWRQAIIWTNAGILFIGFLGTDFSEICIEIFTFSFKKMHLKMSSAKWRPFCFGLDVLKFPKLLSLYKLL